MGTATLLKVLYLVPSTGYGGAETFLRHTAKFHRGVEPVYLCFRAGPLVDTLRALGRKVVMLPEPPRLSRPWTIWRAAKFACRVAGEEGAGLIHSTMAYGALVGGLACLQGGIRHVWFQHGPVTGWMDRAAGILPARAIFVNSEHTRELQRRLSPRRELRSITLGVELSPGETGRAGRDQLRARVGAAKGTILVGTICRPQPQKGLELFVDAIKLARETTGRDVVGVVLGGSEVPGAYEARIRERASSIGAPVRFEPATGLVPEWVSAFDVVISAAVAPEAFGLTLIESLAQGVPVLAPREGGPAGVLDERENGFFFEPRDLASLVRALERVLRLPGPELAARAARGREAVRRKYPAHGSVAQLEKSYAELIG